MHSAVIVFLTCLLVFNAQGHPTNRSSQCKCLNGFVRNDRIPRRHIRERPVVHQPSIFCPHTEIIIKIEKKKMCVDPDSQFGKILTKKNK